jgi:hypothetical protein
MDAQEARRVELQQQVAQGFAVQVADRADVDVQVVVVGADPVDVVDGEHADVFAVAHAEALYVAAGRSPRRLLQAGLASAGSTAPWPGRSVRLGAVDRLTRVLADGC